MASLQQHYSSRPHSKCVISHSHRRCGLCPAGRTPPLPARRRDAPLLALRRARAAAIVAAAGGSGGDVKPGQQQQQQGGERLETPWHFGAQTNERLLSWDEGAQAQLSRIWLCGQLGVEQEELSRRLAALGNLLPDMVAKLHALRAPLVLGLLQDMPGVAERLLALRALLPGADVSALVAQRPELFLVTPMAELQASVAALSAHLPGVSIAALVAREPMLLRADAAALLAEAARLMPGRDPVAVVAADPGALIDMETAALPSTLEHN